MRAGVLVGWLVTLGSSFGLIKFVFVIWVLLVACFDLAWFGICSCWLSAG